MIRFWTIETKLWLRGKKGTLAKATEVLQDVQGTNLKGLRENG